MKQAGKNVSMVMHYVQSLIHIQKRVNKKRAWIFEDMEESVVLWLSS